MKKLILISIFCLINISCQQIMIREYESPLDHQFFRSAKCTLTKEGNYLYSKGDAQYTLSSSHLSKSTKGEVEWEKARKELFYPHGYLDIAVPYMLRDGMTKEEMLNLLGEVDRSSNRFMYYKLNNGAELILFKGTLNMPKGMKNITIQGLQFNDDFKLPALQK
ncbi:hypothetical protein PQO01_04640 [Lentisphaera marina]|uniref:hypothetical protein n=1 Tax=Lentisphaera marina TaxID=1111041 RepID=UPI002365C276|nr:hypothetical protein [Lentisphaera marina]MDD7984232.1 hypothetical protein [Lentisphaera marina]